VPTSEDRHTFEVFETEVELLLFPGKESVFILVSIENDCGEVNSEDSQPGGSVHTHVTNDGKTTKSERRKAIMVTHTLLQ